jgi:hypothetical protein
MPTRTVFNRHVNESNSEAHDLYRVPMRGNKNLMKYKALLRRSPNYYAVKVGLFGSSGRIGQIAQGAGTAIVPGDLSEVRSPVRSGIYSALVPGGIPGTRMGAPSRSGRGYRCPEGFQYGGRFTDNRFSTCGQMLFDIFNLGATVGQTLRPIGQRRTRAGQAEGESNVIEGLSPQERQVIMSRAAQIPKIGAANPSRKAASVTQAMKALRSAEDGTTLMIRRDGFSLQPVVSTAILRTVPDNRNMEGATFLTAVSSTGSFGKDELGLLSNTGVQELKYIAPNGVEMSLAKTRPLTVGERRKLGRTVADVAKMDTSSDPTAPLRALADNSNGGIEYSEKFGKISKANDFVEAQVNGSKKRVRRWVYETFMSGKKPKVAEATTPEEVSPREARAEKIASLAEAIKHLDSGGDPSRVLASLLPVAMQQTKMYRANRVDRFNQIFTGKDGSRIRETVPQYDFQHVGAKFTNEIQRQMGLNSPQMMVAGAGKRQPYYSMYPNNVEVEPAANLDNLPPAEMLKLAVADWLTDARSRNAQNTVLISTQEAASLAGTNNADTALTGVAKAGQSQRQALKLDKFINEERAAFYRQAFDKLTAQQKRSIVNQLDQLIERANGFSFKEYVARLSADGVLSQAERSHLEIVRGIYDARLGALKDSKEAFLQLLGVS